MILNCVILATVATLGSQSPQEPISPTITYHVTYQGPISSQERRERYWDRSLEVGLVGSTIYDGISSHYVFQKVGEYERGFPTGLNWLIGTRPDTHKLVLGLTGTTVVELIGFRYLIRSHSRIARGLGRVGMIGLIGGHISAGRGNLGQ